MVSASRGGAGEGRLRETGRTRAGFTALCAARTGSACPRQGMRDRGGRWPGGPSQAVVASDEASRLCTAPGGRRGRGQAPRFSSPTGGRGTGRAPRRWRRRRPPGRAAPGRCTGACSARRGRARGLLDRQVPRGERRHPATGDRRDVGVPEQPAVGGDVRLDPASLVHVALGDHLTVNREGAACLRPDLLRRAREQRHMWGQHVDHLRPVNRASTVAGCRGLRAECRGVGCPQLRVRPGQYSAVDG